MTAARVFLVLSLIPLSLTSCGYDDDDDGSPRQAQEEGGTTGATGGGTSGGTTGGTGGNSCISSSQKTNIRTVMNKAVGLTTVQGIATVTELQNDGTTLNFQGVGEYVLRKPRNDSWAAEGQFCDDISNCYDSEWDNQIRDDGCFYSDGYRVRLISTSSTRISFNFINEEGDRVQDSISVDHHDKLFLRETVTRNQRTILNFRFDPF